MVAILHHANQSSVAVCPGHAGWAGLKALIWLKTHLQQKGSWESLAPTSSSWGMRKAVGLKENKQISCPDSRAIPNILSHRVQCAGAEVHACHNLTLLVHKLSVQGQRILSSSACPNFYFHLTPQFQPGSPLPVTDSGDPRIPPWENLPAAWSFTWISFSRLPWWSSG